MPRLIYWSLCAAWLPLLLLATQATAQKLPRDYNGHVTYQGCVKLPGHTQQQVLARAAEYAHRHLVGEHSFAAAYLVDSGAYVASGASSYLGSRPLRYELLVRAEAGSYTYELSNLRTLGSIAGSPVVPGAGLRPAQGYELVERVLDHAGSYDRQHRPLPSLRAYCADVAGEVDAVLTQLRAEMGRP